MTLAVAGSNPNSGLKKILILALGGEGGGTLTEWLVEAGLASGWPIQATSIPGVAQRTGATSYYIECLPRVLKAGELAPPMCLAPLAGDLDLIISSELLETARAVEKGLADRERTVIVSSTARALTVDERTAMTEGRWDAQTLQATHKACCAELSLFDMTALAKREGTIVSAVMFGALVGSKTLALTAEVCERVIIGSDGAGSPRSKSSVRGFLAGLEAASTPLREISKAKIESLGQVTALGIARLLDYQDAAYAEQYQQRLNALPFLSPQNSPVAMETARHLALWMSYEDLIRVADLKSRRSRFEKIRADYQAKPSEPVVVKDFLKPGVDEVAAILPQRWAQPLARWAQKRGRQSFGEGIQLATSTVTGLLAMRVLARLRFMRRSSSRFLSEQALIERWLATLSIALRLEREEQVHLEAWRHGEDGLSYALAQLPRMIKGYSATFARGQGAFVQVLEHVLEPELKRLDEMKTPVQGPMRADLLRQLNERLRLAQQTALAQPDSEALYRVLGLAPPPIKEHVIKFARPISRSSTRGSNESIN